MRRDVPSWRRRRVQVVKDVEQGRSAPAAARRSRRINPPFRRLRAPLRRLRSGHALHRSAAARARAPASGHLRLQVVPKRCGDQRGDSAFRPDLAARAIGGVTRASACRVPGFSALRIRAEFGGRHGPSAAPRGSRGGSAATGGLCGVAETCNVCAHSSISRVGFADRFDQAQQRGARAFVA